MTSIFISVVISTLLPTLSDKITSSKIKIAAVSDQLHAEKKNFLVSVNVH